ncbi:VOC family protein [Sporosarcina sp. Te-1]|uniref:VOC family protein n=1 Tax=Sporosarcina sp. Te-1 TaxID=2818390 RepID=UPI0035300AF6
MIIRSIPVLCLRLLHMFSLISFVEDIDDAYRFIQAHDIQVTRKIERIGDFAYFNFKDPDGNVLMICNR